MSDWLAQYEQLLVWIGIVSIVMFIVMIAITPWLVGRIPNDYFVNEKYAHGSPTTLVQWCALLVRNTVGLVLLLLGVVMLFTPGQGIITILLGLIVMRFPGKRALEKRILPMTTC